MLIDNKPISHGNPDDINRLIEFANWINDFEVQEKKFYGFGNLDYWNTCLTRLDTARICKERYIYSLLTKLNCEVVTNDQVLFSLAYLNCKKMADLPSSRKNRVACGAIFDVDRWYQK